MNHNSVISNVVVLILLILLLQVFASCSRRSSPAQVSKESPVVPGNIATAEDLNDAGRNNEEKIDDHARNKLRQFLDSGPRLEIADVKSSADRIIETASRYMGVPHCMGGKTSKCMDCSGLVHVVFREHGILLPHNSREQSRYGSVVMKKPDLVKGDLVFFSGSYRSENYITHSGIYIGNNKFIHASSSKGVIISSLDDSWWKNKFAFGTRVLRE